MVEASTTMMTPQMATAPAPAITSTRCRSVSCNETVDSRKRSIPASSTTATGQIVFNCQFTRIEDTAFLSSAAIAMLALSSARLLDNKEMGWSKLSGPTWLERLGLTRRTSRGCEADSVSVVAFMFWLRSAWSTSGIGMQSRQQISDSEDREHDSRTPHDSQPGPPVPEAAR